MFDFIQAIEMAVNIIPPDRHESLMDYSRLLATAIHRQLEERRRSGAIRFTETPNERAPGGNFTIARVLIDGYFKGAPGRTDLLFSHKGQVPDTQILSRDIDDQPMVYGSGAVAKRFCSDPIFALYRTVQDRPLHRSEVLSTEIHRAKCVIAAQGSPEARAIDPICRYIGGRPHIATVTPGEGFNWVPGFEPIQPF